MSKVCVHSVWGHCVWLWGVKWSITLLSQPCSNVSEEYVTPNQCRLVSLRIESGDEIMLSLLCDKCYSDIGMHRCLSESSLHQTHLCLHHFQHPTNQNYSLTNPYSMLRFTHKFWNDMFWVMFPEGIVQHSQEEALWCIVWKWGSSQHLISKGWDKAWAITCL